MRHDEMTKKKGFPVLKIYDVTAPFGTQLPFYPGDVVMETKEHTSITKGDDVNITRFSFSCHSGTHYDAPKHMFDNGKTIDEFPPERFMGDALVVEIRGKPAVTVQDIKMINCDFSGKFILFKTDNVGAMLQSNFVEDYVYIAPDAAQLLAAGNPNCVGLDYLSLEKYNAPDLSAHYALMNKDVLVLEGLVLDNVPPGEYSIYAFPLMVAAGDGSPARVVLIEK